jgi:hypothetical protein
VPDTRSEEQDRAVFFDGASGQRHEVTMRFGNCLSLHERATELASWSYPSIRVADAPPGKRRFRSLEAPDLARLETVEGVLADRLIAASPNLHRGTLTIATERIVLWSVAAAASILLIVFIGVPYAADRLAPLVPVWSKSASAMPSKVKSVPFSADYARSRRAALPSTKC